MRATRIRTGAIDPVSYAVTYESLYGSDQPDVLPDVVLQHAVRRDSLRRLTLRSAVEPTAGPMREMRRLREVRQSPYLEARASERLVRPRTEASQRSTTQQDSVDVAQQRITRQNRNEVSDAPRQRGRYVELRYPNQGIRGVSHGRDGGRGGDASSRSRGAIPSRGGRNGAGGSRPDRRTDRRPDRRHNAPVVDYAQFDGRDLVWANEEGEREYVPSDPSEYASSNEESYEEWFEEDGVSEIDEDEIMRWEGVFGHPRVRSGSRVLRSTPSGYRPPGPSDAEREHRRLRTEAYRPDASAVKPTHPSMLCPISLEIFRDPVVAEDGHTYERAYIERSLGASKRSPLTGEDLPTGRLLDNVAMRNVVEEHLATL